MRRRAVASAFDSNVQGVRHLLIGSGREKELFSRTGGFLIGARLARAATTATTFGLR